MHVSRGRLAPPSPPPPWSSKAKRKLSALENVWLNTDILNMKWHIFINFWSLENCARLAPPPLKFLNTSLRPYFENIFIILKIHRNLYDT